MTLDVRYPPPSAYVDPDATKPWWRRVMPVVLAHRWVVITGLAAALGRSLVQVAVPAVVKETIDTAILSQRRPLLTFVIVLGVLAGLVFVFTAVYRYQLQRTAFSIEYDLRTSLFDHLSRLSFPFFDRVQTGQLISRANSDIRTVERFFAFAPMMAVTVITFLIALVIMSRMHTTLTLVSLAPLPFVYLVGRKMRSLMFPISWVVQSRAAEVATIVEENVSGVRVVKAFAAEPTEISKLARAAQRLRWATVKQIDIRAVWGPILENIPRIGQALLLFYGGWLVIRGEFTPGGLVAFSSYVIQLQAPFRMLGFLMMMSNRAAASAERILELFDTPAEIVDAPDAVDLDAPRGEVRFDDVTFAYGDGPPLLDGFTLHIAPGETVAIVGRTGCGKSTVPRLLLRAYDVQGGSVSIDGHDVRGVTLRSLRSVVGLVPDEPALFSESVRDNIAFARPSASLEEVEGAAVASDAHPFIRSLDEGYDTVVGERGYTLSGGQRQRIAIARTLVQDPAILVLDDATSSVDVKVEQRIHRALRDVVAQRTTLVIAHRLSTIALADRVVLMDGGRVLAQGTHDQLMRTVPLYAEVLATSEEEYAAAHPAPDAQVDIPAPEADDLLAGVEG